MGRNSIPKLGEWRGGEMYEIVCGDTLSPPSPDDGRMIAYRVRKYNAAGTAETVEILATFWADGFQECIAAAYAAGFHKGEKSGREAKCREIRVALGLRGHED